MISDTKEEAERRQNEIFKRLSGEEKLRLAMAFSDTIRDIAWAGFCQRHPSLPDETLRAMFIKEIHGIDIRKGSGGQRHE